MSEQQPQKRIKVLFRHRSMEMGGVEKVLLSMLRNLDQSKFELKVNVNLHQGELRDEIPPDIPTTFLARGKEDFSKNPLLNKLQLALRALKLRIFRLFPAIPDRWIIKNDADVEIATGYTMYADVLNSSNKKSKKIAWLHSDLSLDGFAPIRSTILQQLQQFDFVIYGSQQISDVMHSVFPEVKIKKSEVVLNAIDVQELREKAAQNNAIRLKKPNFISVGRLHYRKGYRTLLEAHAALLKRGYHHFLYIVGDGEDRDLLKEKINELKIGDTCILLGTLVNPYPLIRAADFYVMPSESEGWPLIIAETLLLRKKIVATAVGGVPEMIRSEENGLLVGTSAEEIADGMARLMSDQDLQNTIEKQLITIDSQFDPKKIFAAVESIITNTYTS